MLSFFRRFSKSPIGIGIFGLILIAFVVTLYEGKSGMNVFQGDDGQSVVTVGGKTIGENELVRRIQNQLEAERQQHPGATMADLVARGGVERAVDQTAAGRALEIFAGKQGMIASRKLVDGAIASIPAFFGPTGSFDRTAYLGALAQRKISEPMLRDDFGREAVSKMLIIPAAGAARVPAALVQPYASLLLETRTGQIAEVLSTAFTAGIAPTDTEVQTYYQRNIGRYSLPERRIVRYAAFDKTRFAGVKASDDEIAKYYADNAATYGPSEKRAFTQVIVPTAPQAAQLLAKVQSGTPIGDAARQIGRDAIAVAVTDQAGFAKLSGPDVARAAFAAPGGGFATVQRSGLGFHVVRVDTVKTIAATTLAAARPAIAIALTASKQRKAIGAMVADIDNALGNRTTLDEVVRKYALTAAASPPLASNGTAPEVAGYAPPPAIQAVIAEAFQGDVADQAAIASLPDGGYVVWKLDRVIAAAPRPLAQVRDQVIADARRAKAARSAKVVADKITSAINGGTPLAQALSGAGVALPPAQPVKARRIDISRAQQKAPPPIELMFAMPQKHARVLEMPQQLGWFIVYVDQIEPGDARMAPGLIQATQEQLSGALGDEYVQQFANAVSKQVGVTTNAAAVQRLKSSLLGGVGQ